MTKRPGGGRLGASFRNRYRRQVPGQERGGAQLEGRVYQGAVEAVFAIPVAAGLGWLADRHFGSAPIGLLIGIGIGFAAFVLRLVRLGREMQAGAANQETPAPAPDSSRDEREAARIGGGDDHDDHDDHDDDWGEDHRTH